MEAWGTLWLGGDIWGGGDVHDYVSGLRIHDGTWQEERTETGRWNVIMLEDNDSFPHAGQQSGSPIDGSVVVDS